MHFCTFVVIGRLGDVDKLVAKALAPFSEDLALPPWRNYLKKYQIALMAEHYNLDKHDARGLAKHMEEWTGHPGGVDRKGLYEITTENPDGRWDWYEIGGHWRDYIKGAGHLQLPWAVTGVGVQPRTRNRVRSRQEQSDARVVKGESPDAVGGGHIGRRQSLVLGNQLATERRAGTARSTGGAAEREP